MDLFSVADPSDAEAKLQRALRLWEVALGPGHPKIAGLLNNLGNVRQQLGQYEDAAAALERALAIWKEAYGPDHRDVGIATPAGSSKLSSAPIILIWESSTTTSLSRRRIDAQGSDVEGQDHEVTPWVERCGLPYLDSAQVAAHRVSTPERRGAPSQPSNAGPDGCQPFSRGG